MLHQLFQLFQKSIVASMLHQRCLVLEILNGYKIKKIQILEWSSKGVRPKIWITCYEYSVLEKNHYQYSESLPVYTSGIKNF